MPEKVGLILLSGFCLVTLINMFCKLYIFVHSVHSQMSFKQVCGRNSKIKANIWYRNKRWFSQLIEQINCNYKNSITYGKATRYLITYFNLTTMMSAFLHSRWTGVSRCWLLLVACYSMVRLVMIVGVTNTQPLDSPSIWLASQPYIEVIAW